MLFTEFTPTVSDRFFHINYSLQSQDRPQFVVITPKKLGLNAVQRNRIQRRVYALVRGHYSSWTVGVRIAIVVKKAAIDSSAEKFRDHLLELLSSINISQHA